MSSLKPGIIPFPRDKTAAGRAEAKECWRRLDEELTWLRSQQSPDSERAISKDFCIRGIRSGLREL